MDPVLSFDDVYWLIWLVVIFLPFELWAAFSKKKGDTFSENVWDWFAIRRLDAPLGFLRRFFLAAFLTGLGSHFLFATSVVPVIVFGVGVGWSIYYHYTHEVRR